MIHGWDFRPPVVFSYLVWCKYWFLTLDENGRTESAVETAQEALATAKEQFATVMLRCVCKIITVHLSIPQFCG